MKHYLCILLLSLTLFACQVIREGEQTILIDQLKGQSSVLLVEFTGVGCVNCPTAAQEAAKLKSAYADNLVVVAMHPASNPFTQAQPPYDYTCREADEYYTYFNGTPSTSFPAGVVNFAKSDNSFFTDYTAWGKHIAQQSARPSVASLALQTNLDTVNRRLSLKVNALTDQSATLVLWLVESNITGAQMMPDGTLNTAYTHNHVLRQALNGTWGETLAPNDSIAKQYVISHNYDLNHCSVVGLLLNSDQEVIAVSEKYLTGSNEPDTQPNHEDPDTTQNVSDSPMLISIDGLGEITADTIIEISEVQINPLTGKYQIELTGMIAFKGTLNVGIERSDSDSNDQFCCGDKCVNTNYEVSQQLTFQLAGLSKWFTHVVFDQPAEYTIHYTFSPNNGQPPLILTVKYIYR